MSYVYDIVLNFNNLYYEYYEWKTSDKIINVKKIPIYRVKTVDYINIKDNKIVININKMPKQNKMFLVTNGMEVMGLLLNNKGNVIKKSSLIFEESDDILNNNKLPKIIDIDYKIERRIKTISRNYKEKTDYIKKYIKKIINKNNKYLLKYLYYDIYKLDENNLEKIDRDLKYLFKNDVNKLYISLQNITRELNI